MRVHNWYLYSPDDDPQLRPDADVLLVSDPQFSNLPNPQIQTSELAEICNVGHALKLEMFLLMDQLLDEDQLQKLRTYLPWIEAIGFDGVMFADVGVGYEILTKGLRLKSVYDPGDLISSSGEAHQFLKQGFDLVVPSRNLSFDQALLIAQKHKKRILFDLRRFRVLAASKRKLLSDYFENKKIKKQADTYWMIEEKRKSGLEIKESDAGTFVVGSLPSPEVCYSTMRSYGAHFLLDIPQKGERK